jgi:hypothetical protein
MMTAITQTAPGLGWVFGKSFQRMRSLMLLFSFLFLLAMPIALLIIGRDNYLTLVSSYNFLEPVFREQNLNQVLWPLHLLLALISLVAVAVLASAGFRTFYLQNAVDRESSMPLGSNRQCLGRALALLAAFCFIFAVNAAVTFAVFAGWGKIAHFFTYSTAYLRLFAATLELLAFSLVFLALSGTLFDAVLTCVGIQFAWASSVFHILGMTNRLTDLETDILWLLAPAARLFIPILLPVSAWQSLVMIVFWSIMAWFFYKKRPAEYAGVRNGQLPWYPVLQPFFVLLGGTLLGSFVHGLFAGEQSTLRSPVFYMGLVAGALLGQVVSTVVSGKQLRKTKIAKEILPILGGLTFFALMTGLVCLCMAPAATPW